MTQELQGAIRELLCATDDVAQREGGWKTSETAIQTIGRFVEERSAQGQLHAIVTVSGGVAYVAQEPPNVRVHLIDYDDLQADFAKTFDQLSIEARAFYSEAESRMNDDLRTNKQPNA